MSAYLAWGLVPIYWKRVTAVPPLELLAHRVVWSFVLTSLLLTAQRNWPIVLTSLKDRAVRTRLAATTALIALNWFTFIWAVGHDQILQASLGYYINPLINVLLGFLFLGERLRRMQIVSVAIAAAGVTFMTAGYGRVPWVALILALSFGLYGLLRKTAKIGSLVGLHLESGLLWPVAAGYLVYLSAGGTGSFGAMSRTMDGLLVLAGLITAGPLLLFAASARRVTLATLGFLQYLAPSLQFLLAVLVYDERFTVGHGITFGCIWLALGIYSFDAVRQSRKPGL